MASAALATTSLPTILSLLSNRIISSSSSSTKRSLSLLSHPATPRALRPRDAPPSSASADRRQTTRRLSRYVAVNHAAAYRKSMDSDHGTQLRLALEEGRGKDDAPFDPFSQFLDRMGRVEDDGDVDEEEGLQEMENAELREMENENDEFDDEDPDCAGRAARFPPPPPKYTAAGALRRPLSQRIALRAGYPSGGKFAVIRLEGFQHKVTADDLLVVNKLKPAAKWSVGSRHTLGEEEVLLVADAERTCVGLPGVRGAEVDLMVEEITRDKTVIVFKKRRRKNSRRKNGHRRQVTFLRVLGVRFPGETTEREEEERVAA